MEGTVRTVRFHDFALSAAERADNVALLCACAPLEDCVVEASIGAGVQDIAHQRIETRLYRWQELNQDIGVLSVKTPRSRVLRFLSGQHARLSLHESVTATLRIASCACDGRNLEFHVQRSPNEPFSEALFGGLARNHPITIEGPLGHFVLDEVSNRPLLIIAIGGGFASAQSLMEHALNLELDQSIHIVRLYADAHELYLDNICRAWSDAFDNVTYTQLAFEDTPDAVHNVTQVLTRWCKQTSNALSDHDLYICADTTVRESIAAALPPTFKHIHTDDAP